MASWPTVRLRHLATPRGGKAYAVGKTTTMRLILGLDRPWPVAKSPTLALSWCFRCSSGRSPVFADQAVDHVVAFDPAGHIDRLARLGQRRSLLPRLVRPVLVVMPRVLGRQVPKVLFAVDQHVVEALAA